MKFDVLTLFPELFVSVMGESIIGRAQKNGLVEVNAVNIRDYSKDKHRKVDDYPFGGGNGMVMMCQPVIDAYKAITEEMEQKPKVLYMSPQGKVLTQDMAKELSTQEHLILLCGHYEGIDERIIEEIVDEEISIGDYVLTGGELPAMVLIDCVSRLIPGVLSTEGSFSDESHFNGLLEYPQYTRPADYNGNKVPDVLLSGHHANIDKWRMQQSLNRTREKRPDLYEKFK
ncbi:tRNA (guanine-N1)-methyltransferase [Ruminiclostridium papyrosolvens DSM 2782]|uniref:tRNA (guanine-N(1)-)-methyltransferase n=1 Tax=Ruminiclostridium papyrosolvens DSM 2782 TaxID=588581 RepID=F1TI81_9FIRM|nr:tRNA (guanosine(37)-N1)-methyltransferase TrmD [Ruminiclostridium papyrosolvens]EGD45859.1 tRNA (guanine-N1)-methyltransferase [Ruminiclostridium papyrosolvens DSM 2782]WES36341.1 tRNA (guanosine(37)-N1)-methyltransferase TrmD [Ruminiclostridium papyrosolvens DSM 2782]